MTDALIPNNVPIIRAYFKIVFPYCFEFLNIPSYSSSINEEIVSTLYMFQFSTWSKMFVKCSFLSIQERIPRVLKVFQFLSNFFYKIFSIFNYFCSYKNSSSLSHFSDYNDKHLFLGLFLTLLNGINYYNSLGVFYRILLNGINDSFSIGIFYRI